jgi:pimeloyl-ACP methyl ester carboxylesterase
MPGGIRQFWSPEIKAKYVAAYEAVLTQWPVGYEQLDVPTRFGDTHVIVSGQEVAAPLVLLHPAGGGSTIWHRNVGPLSQHFRTYAVDVIGDLNRSTLTRRLQSRSDFADWIVDLFDALRIPKASIVGNSYGGFLALSTAVCRPERVEKVVLISPAATFAPIWPIYWHTIIPGYWLAPVIRSEALCHRAADWVWQGFPLDEHLARLRAISQVGGYPRYRPTLNPPPTVFHDDELRSIRAPVLLLIGDHEVIYKPERVIERARRLVPHLEAEVIPDANHCAEYTAPDVVNEKILDFLLDSRGAQRRPPRPAAAQQAHRADAVS